MGATQRLTPRRTPQRWSFVPAVAFLFLLLCDNCSKKSPALTGVWSSSPVSFASAAENFPWLSVEKGTVSGAGGNEGSSVTLHASAGPLQDPGQNTQHRSTTAVPSRFGVTSSGKERFREVFPLNGVPVPDADAFREPSREQQHPLPVFPVGEEEQEGQSGSSAQSLEIFSPPFSGLYSSQQAIEPAFSAGAVIPTVSARAAVRAGSLPSPSLSFSVPFSSASFPDSTSFSDESIHEEAVPPRVISGRKRNFDRVASSVSPRSLFSQVTDLLPPVPSLFSPSSQSALELNTNSGSSSPSQETDDAVHPASTGPWGAPGASRPGFSGSHAVEPAETKQGKEGGSLPLLLSTHLERARQRFDDVKQSLRPTFDTVRNAISSFVAEAPRWADGLGLGFFDEHDDQDEDHHSYRREESWNPSAARGSEFPETGDLGGADRRHLPASALSGGDVLSQQNKGPAGTRSKAKKKKVLPPFEEQIRKKMLAVQGWYTDSIGGTMNGRRERDEDALIVHATLDNFRDMRLVALFDGHSGFDVSRFCANHASAVFGRMRDLSPEAFRQACLTLDAALYNRPGQLSRSGSTGILVGVRSARTPMGDLYFQVHAANVGDSRALLLYPDGTYVPLSKDHKPSDEEERRRIEAAGGSVVKKASGVARIDGRLAVSRAFGDFSMKQEDSLPPEAQRVVAVPDVVEVVALPGDILLLACDGLFEAKGMDWDFVANLLHQSLHENAGDIAAAAFQLLSTAFARGSGDNVSLVLTRLQSTKFSEYTVRRFDLVNNGEILEYPFESESILESQVAKGSRSSGVENMNFTLF
ncbi:protein phosphatase 2c domain-containing protein [Cystoisospora suis]|uniref:Protein phosphatase 2c domain-containing protein n=1 Tax=Cystoisospora suis TaxID=483139 RepID=A0A2C6L2B5_9APIC|nr:protein phosphatase 2c domain-containing protein [Cystoisospora suis]